MVIPDVALSPGRAFGEGYVRVALVENEQRVAQAMRNLERALLPAPPQEKAPPRQGLTCRLASARKDKIFRRG